MPRKWINKKSATTYQVRYREQNDPRIHEEGGDLVLHEVGSTAQRRGVHHRADLEAELFEHGFDVRPNEGEAAEHGVYFDDTEYDYMQHLRDLGGGGAAAGGAAAVWLDAPEPATSTAQGKRPLEQALRELDLEGSDAASKITDPDLLPSTQLRHMTYQDQQDVPDALAGFQPDMDLRLREVLEALDDDAYIDADGDENFFGSIAAEREELTTAEFQRIGARYTTTEGKEGAAAAADADADADEDGWESDDTAKPENEDRVPADRPAPLPTDGGDHGDGEFMATFRDLPPAARRAAPAPRGAGSLLTASSAWTAGGRHKKRKGARTSSDAFSMTSSSLARTDALTTLDARFEKTLESYMEDEDDAEAGSLFDDDAASLASGRLSNISGLSGLSGASHVSRAASQAPSLVDNAKFNGIMDDFLGNYSHTGKRRVVKRKPQTGMQQLDEIRRELGPPVGRAAKAGPS